MIDRVLSLIVVLFSLVVTCSVCAQVEISPAEIDFGTVGTSLIGGASYSQLVTVTNISLTKELTIHTVNVVGRDVYQRNDGYPYKGVGTEVAWEVRLKPKDSRRYVYQYYSWDPMERYTDSLYFVVSYADDAKRDTLYVPVHARSVAMTTPFIVSSRDRDRYYCHCLIEGRKFPVTYTGGEYVYLYNAGNDTLRLDSVKTPVITPGLVLQDTVYSYDVIDTIDTVGNWPPGHWSTLPRMILPTMPLYIDFAVNALPPGPRFALVDAYLTNTRTGEHFVLSDTVDEAIVDYPFVLQLNPSTTQIYRRIHEVDSSTAMNFAVSTCTVPGNGPVTIENVEFRGPRQDELTILPRFADWSLPTMPHLLSCDSIMRYRTLFRPDVAGNTVDTLWVRYHYFDSTTGQQVTDSNYVLYYFYVSGPLSVSAGHEKPEMGHVTAMPNPAFQRLHIQWNNGSDYTTGYRPPVHFRLYDASGRNILLNEVTLSPGGGADVDVSSLSAGMYTVVVFDESTVRGSTSVVIVR